MKNTSTWQQRISIALITLSVTTSAFADPPEQAVEHKAARKPKALSAEAAAREEHPGGTQQQAAVKAMQVALRRANRDQVRKQRHEELQLRLHGHESTVPMRMELRNHARRISRLQRIRQLAVTTDATLLPHIDDLIARETARHERRLAALITRANAAGPAHVEDREPDEEVEE